MDIARPDLARKKRLRRLAYGAVLVVAVPALTIGVSRLKPAAPVGGAFDGLAGYRASGRNAA